MPQGGSPVKEFQLIDTDGEQAFVNCVQRLSIQDSTTYATWAETGGKVIVTARDAWDSTEPALFDVEATDVDAPIGKFKIALTPDHLTVDGVYLLQYVLVNKDDGIVLINHSYLDIIPNLNTVREHATGQRFSVAKLRRRLRDTHPRANRILEECEFSYPEIFTAIDTVLQEFNSEPPIISSMPMTPAIFPWPDRLEQGVIAELLAMAGMWYERNNLRSQGAGVVADDMNKGSFYLNLAAAKKQEWLRWTQLAKRQMNINNGWGRVSSRVYP